MNEPPPKPVAFKAVSIVLVVSGVGQGVAAFYCEGILASVLVLSGGMEIVAGAVFWMLGERTPK